MMPLFIAALASPNQELLAWRKWGSWPSRTIIPKELQRNHPASWAARKPVQPNQPKPNSTDRPSFWYFPGWGNTSRNVATSPS